MLRYHTFLTVTPYLDTAPAGYPRAVIFRVAMIQAQPWLSVVSVEADGSEVERFEGGPYRPGGGEWDDRRAAEDVTGFAVAYVERPEEFDRPPSAREQHPTNAAWWRAHGEALSCELEVE